MTIVEALKSDKIYDIRVTCGDRWLVVSALTDEFVVYERKRYARNTTVVFVDYNEADAVAELIKGQVE